MASVTHGSAGGSETLVATPSTTTVASKGLTAGTGISLGSSSSAVTITNSDPASGVTLTNAGTTTLVNDGTGPALATKGLVAGDNISFSTSSTDVTITGSNYQSGDQVCIVRKSTDTNFTDGSTTTLLWDVEELDTAGMHNNSMNTDRITIIEDGVYDIKLSVSALKGAGSATGIITLVITLFDASAGSSYRIGQDIAVPTQTISLNAVRLMALSATDYLTATLINSSGITVTVYSVAFNSSFLNSPVFSVCKISEIPS